MKIDEELFSITKKFYRNEKERQELIEANQQHIEVLMQQLGGDIAELKKANIEFFIFFMDFSVNKPVLFGGLRSCCGKKFNIPKDVRQSLKDKILAKTIFEKVIWEL